MKYFPSPYINALSKFDDRFEVYKGETTDTLLIEEKSMDLFLAENSSAMNLIVLVESEQSVLQHGSHTIIKRILKFKKIKQLLVEIFDERYEIRLFIDPFSSGSAIANLMEQNVINAAFIDVFDEYQYSDTLISEKNYLMSGVHYFYSSILDVMDPPIPFMLNAVLKESEHDTVDIVLYSLNGSLVKNLIEISDIIYILVHENNIRMMELLKKKYSNIVFLNCSCSGEVEISNMVARRGIREGENELSNST